MFINNKIINDDKNIHKSKSLKRKFMDLFKFPLILKNETKANLQNFFDKCYIVIHIGGVNTQNLGINNSIIIIIRISNKII